MTPIDCTHPYVAARDIFKSFHGEPETPFDPAWVLNGVSLDIRRGESLGLVGESGSGKSTLGRIILGMTKPTRGSVSFEGVDIGRESESERRLSRAKRQIVFQDPVGALNPRRTVAENIELPLINFGWAPARRQQRVDELMSIVGLEPGHKSRFPHQFSGGQCQRIVIARAIALDPEFLFLDEPVSALDASVQAQIINLLVEIRDKLRLTCLFVSHDLKVVKTFCDRTAVLYHGQLVEIGPSREVFENPLHPYTRALRAAVLSVRRRSDLSSFMKSEILGAVPTSSPACRYVRHCHLRRAICETARPEPVSLSPTRQTACHVVKGDPGASADRKSPALHQQQEETTHA
ncbi:MAG: oligopeptide/dipeptide ABC transporter ATP-binding protein [Parvibaculaceae bacterium]